LFVAVFFRLINCFFFFLVAKVLLNRREFGRNESKREKEREKMKSRRVNRKKKREGEREKREKTKTKKKLKLVLGGEEKEGEVYQSRF